MTDRFLSQSAVQAEARGEAQDQPVLVRKGPLTTALVRLLILPIRGYQLLLSPWIGHSCRFQPSCSVYAIEALETHGPFRGTWLTIWRLARCNPWGGSGYDPVPPAANKDASRDAF